MGYKLSEAEIRRLERLIAEKGSKYYLKKMMMDDSLVDLGAWIRPEKLKKLFGIEFMASRPGRIRYKKPGRPGIPYYRPTNKRLTLLRILVDQIGRMVWKKVSRQIIREQGQRVSPGMIRALKRPPPRYSSTRVGAMTLMRLVNNVLEELDNEPDWPDPLYGSERPFRPPYRPPMRLPSRRRRPGQPVPPLEQLGFYVDDIIMNKQAMKSPMRNDRRPTYRSKRRRHRSHLDTRDDDGEFSEEDESDDEE